MGKATPTPTPLSWEHERRGEGKMGEVGRERSAEKRNPRIVEFVAILIARSVAVDEQ